jgi:hypothetical protein
MPLFADLASDYLKAELRLLPLMKAVELPNGKTLLDLSWTSLLMNMKHSSTRENSPMVQMDSSKSTRICL